MRAADKIHIMLLQETRDNIRTEGERNTTIIFTPTSDILVRI